LSKSTPLYIRDREVTTLARRLQTATKARTIADALRREMDRANAAAPPSQRIQNAIALADSMGPGEASDRIVATSAGRC